MPRRKSVDSAKLIAAVKSGRSSTEIMTEFGIKTSGQLKSLYVDALAAAGQITGIIAAKRTSKKPEKQSKELRVNKRGSLVVPRDLIDEMGFNVGDSFAVRKTAAGVSLKKAT